VTVVELDAITVVRGGATLLDRVSWHIRRGEHAALLGANGSGKTTLLKVMTGYEWPTSGRVRVLDAPFGACDLRMLRRHIGWVSSAMERRILPHEPAWQVVGSGFDASLGLYRPLTEPETQRCQALFGRLGVGEIASRPFGLLSQGEQKRVLIARALVLEPALLVLDEPCAGLDPASRVDFLVDLGQLAQKHDGPTILLVTHHLEEIRPWIRRVLALRRGRVAAEAPREGVLTDAVMSDVFSRPCRVVRVGAELTLRFEPGPVDQLP
jgi:iron complex transport system ATP-binding protein